jgi:hypothetical protein
MLSVHVLENFAQNGAKERLGEQHMYHNSVSLCALCKGNEGAKTMTSKKFMI